METLVPSLIEYESELKRELQSIEIKVPLCTHIFRKRAFRFPNAHNHFYFHLSVKDTNHKPDILDPIKDTLEVELGKVGCVITIE